MNLADARFGQIKHLRDFAQVQILAVIQRKNLALHVGKLFEPLENAQRRSLASATDCRGRLQVDTFLFV